MTIIKTISLILLAYTVIYMILKAIATNEEYQKSLHPPAEDTKGRLNLRK